MKPKRMKRPILEPWNIKKNRSINCTNDRTIASREKSRRSTGLEPGNINFMKGPAIKIACMGESLADDTRWWHPGKKGSIARYIVPSFPYTFLLLQRFKLYLGPPLAYVRWTFQINEATRRELFNPAVSLFLRVSCFPRDRASIFIDG